GGLRADSQSENLVSKADTIYGDLPLQELTRRLDGIVAGLRVARPGRQKDAIGIQDEYRFGRGTCANDSNPATAVDQQAQDTVLDPEIVGDDVILRLGGGGRPGTQVPHSLLPALLLINGHRAGKVLPDHPRERTR